jgi:hypothetical protein
MMILLAAAIESASAEPANFHQTYTVHPLGALVGVYQISGEWRTADKVGVMLSPRLVYKKYKDEEESVTTQLSTTDLEELGFGATVQGRYYALGTFPTGLFLAGLGGGFWDSIKGTVDGDPAELERTTIVFGAVAGAKVSFPVGLALDGDVGVAFSEELRSATVGTTSAVPDSGFGVGLLVELRAGWSF